MTIALSPPSNNAVIKKEHIEAIVFSSTLSISPTRTTTSSAAKASSANPFLEKPQTQRLVSYEDMEELTLKLNDMMMKMSSLEVDVLEVEHEEPFFYQDTECTDQDTTERTSNTRRPQSYQRRRHESCNTGIPVKHCIVDLDEALERWPPLSNEQVHSFTSNNSNTRHSIDVIPEPSDMDRTNEDEPRTKRKHSIRLGDVLRMREWGQRLFIPQQLLRPPMIRRQPSSE